MFVPEDLFVCFFAYESKDLGYLVLPYAKNT